MKTLISLFKNKTKKITLKISRMNNKFNIKRLIKKNRK